jgi:hypothetical protein
MRVVDDHHDVVLRTGDDLEAPGYGVQCLNAFFDRIERKVERDTRRNGREDVVDVRTADEFRLRPERATRCPDVERKAIERVRERPRGDIGGLVDGT